MKYGAVRAGSKSFSVAFSRFASVLVILIGSLASSSFLFANAPADTDEIRQMMRQATKLIRSGSLADAEKLLRRALQMDPLRSDTKLELAYLLVKQRNLAEA